MAATIQDGERISATLVADVSSDYQQRKESGRCTYPGCPNACADDSSLCPEHRDANRARAAKAMRKKRAAWYAQDLCLRCGAPRAPGSAWHCVACEIALGRAKPTSVTTTVNKSERTAARSIEVAGRGRNRAARARYRGHGKRGAMSWAQLDAQDLDDMIKKVQMAKEGLVYARSPEVAELPRVQRKAALDAALAQVDHGMRFGEDLLRRHHYERISAQVGAETDDDEA